MWPNACHLIVDVKDDEDAEEVSRFIASLPGAVRF